MRKWINITETAMTGSNLLDRLSAMKVGEKVRLDNVDPKSDDEETMRVERRADGFYGDCGKYDWTAGTAEQACAKLTRSGYTKLTEGSFDWSKVKAPESPLPRSAHDEFIDRHNAKHPRPWKAQVVYADDGSIYEEWPEATESDAKRILSNRRRDNDNDYGTKVRLTYQIKAPDGSTTVYSQPAPRASELPDSHAHRFRYGKEPR